MKRDLEIWVFGDHRHHPNDRSTLQILGHARALCGERGRVTALILGHKVEGVATEYIAYGAQRVLLVDHPQLALYDTDLFTTIMSDLIKEHKPEVFLVGASKFGKELAAQNRQANRCWARGRLCLFGLGRQERESDRVQPGLRWQFFGTNRMEFLQTPYGYIEPQNFSQKDHATKVPTERS